MRQNNYFRKARQNLKDARSLVEKTKEQKDIETLNKNLKTLKQKSNGRWYYFSRTGWFPIKASIVEKLDLSDKEIIKEA